MIDFVVAVNEPDVYARNFARSVLTATPGARVQVQTGYRSAALAYNAALASTTSELIVFAHQDVYLPSRWQLHLESAVVQLARQDPNWAVLGVFGAARDGRHVGHVWSSGINRMLGAPFEQPTAVDSLDELLLIVRRSAGLRFDDGLPGYHLHGTDIVQTAWVAGRSAYAVCAPVVHNSRPVLYIPADYLSAYEYLRRKWTARLPIHNCISPIVNSRWRSLRRSLRHRIDAWRFSGIDRRRLDRNLDCMALSAALGLE
jgi:hypothetical protein